jgi:hypothetical protein
MVVCFHNATHPPYAAQPGCFHNASQFSLRLSSSSGERLRLEMLFSHNDVVYTRWIQLPFAIYVVAIVYMDAREKREVYTRTTNTTTSRTTTASLTIVLYLTIPASKSNCTITAYNLSKQSTPYQLATNQYC